VDDWLDRSGVRRDQTFPPNRPDLNLQEDVWAQMVKYMMGENVQTVARLERAIRKVWAKIDTPFLQRLYGTWRRRLRAVIAANGGNTKY